MPAPPKPDVTDQVVAAIQTYCGWHIAPSVDETLTLDGPGGSFLILPSLHVTDVTSITENGTVLPDGSDVNVPAEYTWSERGIIQRGRPVSWTGSGTGPFYGTLPGGCWWTTQLRGIQVELTHGYDDWPPELAWLIDAAASRLKDNPTGLEQQTVGPFTEKYATSAGGAAGQVFTSGEVALLGLYRLPGRP